MTKTLCMVYRSMWQVIVMFLHVVTNFYFLTENWRGQETKGKESERGGNKLWQAGSM